MRSPVTGQEPKWSLLGLILLIFKHSKGNVYESWVSDSAIPWFALERTEERHRQKVDLRWELTTLDHNDFLSFFHYLNC